MVTIDAENKQQLISQSQVDLFSSQGWCNSHDSQKHPVETIDKRRDVDSDLQLRQDRDHLPDRNGVSFPCLVCVVNL